MCYRPGHLSHRAADAVWVGAVLCWGRGEVSSHPASTHWVPFVTAGDVPGEWDALQTIF